MNKFLKTLYFSLILLSGATLASAALGPYTPLVALPGVPPTIDTTQTDLSSYLNILYKFGVAGAAGLAVIMVIWGGVEYITAVAGEGKSGGKERITSAILGLLLALGSFIILQTINPDLLSLKFTLPDAKIKIDANTGGGTGAPEPYVDDFSNTIGMTGYSGTADVQTAPDGTITAQTGNIKMDNDGPTPPSFSDPYRQNQTTSGMDSATQDFAVAPLGIGITSSNYNQYQAVVTDHTTNQTYTLPIGDLGPKNQYGEFSNHFLVNTTQMSNGTSDSVEHPHNVTIIISHK